MEFEKNIVPSAESIKIANRLKELRSKKELSFEQLKKVLFEEYSIKISVDSLKNYEITEDHIRANSNLGMRIEYLNCFADFYGVTADYLLGRTDDPAPHPSAVNELKLTPNAIKNILDLKKEYYHDIHLWYLSQVLESKALTYLIYGMEELAEMKKNWYKYDSLGLDNEDLVYDNDLIDTLESEYPAISGMVYVLMGDEAIEHYKKNILKDIEEMIDKITEYTPSNKDK